MQIQYDALRMGADLFRVQQSLTMIVQEASSLDEKHLPRLLEFASYAYELAPRRSIDWTVVLAQGCHESKWLQSPVSLTLNNTAGIKYGPNFPEGSRASDYRSYATLRDGTADHIDLLAVYCGQWVPDMTDPTRNVRIRNLLWERLGGRYAEYLDDLNGIWAYPGTEYGQNVERVWNTIMERT